MAFTLNDLWRPYSAMGDLEAARAQPGGSPAVVAGAREPADVLREPLEHGALLALAGDNAEALALSDESRRIAAEIGNPWGQSYSLLNSYHVDVSQGDIGRALAKMHECIECAERSGFMVPLAATRADMGVLYANLGQSRARHPTRCGGPHRCREPERARDPARAGIGGRGPPARGTVRRRARRDRREHHRQTPRSVVLLGGGQRTDPEGAIAAIRGDHAQAVDVADRVLAWLRPLDVRPYDPAALLLKGTSLAALGGPDEAERILLEARKSAEQLGFAPMTVADRHGVGRDRRERRRRATSDRAPSKRQGRSSIASPRTIDDEELLASFIGLPEVEAATAGGTPDP